MTETNLDFVSEGRDALRENRWAEARDLFQKAVEADRTSVDAWEGLAGAYWWLHDEAGVFAAREKAYELFRRGGDRRGAARMAIWLGLDSMDFRGQPAVASGWFARAKRLLEGDSESPEYATLLVWEGHLALMLNNDSVLAKDLAARGADLARHLGHVDAEMLAVGLEGLALVTEGAIEEGMRRLDEASAAVVGGEMSDRTNMASTICFLMDACDRVRDYDRAAQWCARARDIGDLWGSGILLALCRPHYAVVLMWRGEFAQAEEQLITGNREMLSFRPLMVVEGIVRLAELRWRQGRWDEADALFEQVKGEGLAQLGMAELALSRGQATFAIDLAEKYLRRLPAADRIERAFGLEIKVRALVAGGRAGEAEPHVEELRETALIARTDPLRGAAALCAGIVSAAAHNLEAARACLEDAADYYDRHPAPFEAARARMELAQVLATLGRADAATREARAAYEAFDRMQAVREAQRAMKLLADVDPASARALAAENELGISPREIEVLRYVAAGRSNQEIAAELVLSVRTVERHISTIYEKIGASGKAARAAAAAYAHRHGLT